MISIRFSVHGFQRNCLSTAKPSIAIKLVNLFSSKRENDWAPYKTSSDILKPTLKTRKVQSDDSPDRDTQRSSDWRKLPTDNRKRSEGLKYFE